MDRKGDFLAGLLVGGVVGFLVGILTAPGSGEETRRTIALKGRETAQRVRGTAEKAREGLVHVASSVKEQVGQAVQKIRSRGPEVDDGAAGPESDLTEPAG